MDIMEGLKFPMNDKDWIKKVLIGGLLNIIPIVNFISTGYSLETMKLIINNTEKLPEWDNFGSKFVKGLVSIIISMIYLIIPFIIMLVLLYLNKIAGLIIGFILTMIFGFIIPMAIANFVAKDSFGAAFEFGEIINRIKSVFEEYFICYLVIIGLYIIVSIVMLIPIIGWILGSIFIFYIQLVYAYYFGTLYAKSSP
ncbi:conserved membrane protein of unknown function [Methanocaldococcus lauensis]|nr:conserved membrane protein of unknown function [Methanocaldococcus lauensis]